MGRLRNKNFKSAFVKKTEMKLNTLLSFTATIHAQYTEWFGKCPEPTDFNLNLTQYAGRWYDVSRVPVSYQEDNAVCPMVMYTLAEDEKGEYIIVNNTQILVNWDGSKTSEFIIGQATMDNPDEPNQLKVSFNFENAFLRWIVNLFQRFSGSNYWVMDTDYKRYSLVVSCENWWFLVRKSGWILARDPDLQNQYLLSE